MSFPLIFSQFSPPLLDLLYLHLLLELLLLALLLLAVLLMLLVSTLLDLGPPPVRPPLACTPFGGASPSLGAPLCTPPLGAPLVGSPLVTPPLSTSPLTTPLGTHPPDTTRLGYPLDAHPLDTTLFGTPLGAPHPLTKRERERERLCFPYSLCFEMIGEEKVPRMPDRHLSKACA